MEIYRIVVEDVMLSLWSTAQFDPISRACVVHNLDETEQPCMSRPQLARRLALANLASRFWPVMHMSFHI